MPEYTIEHVTDDLYQITISTDGIDLNAPTSNIELAIFYIDRDGGTLIDAAFENTADLVIEGVDELGSADQLVVTHGHPDHVGGADEVTEALDLETYLPANEESAIEALDGEPDVRYEDGDEFLGLEAIHCPGDTPGSFALLSPSDEALVGGDVINGSDFRNLPPGYLLPPPAVFADDLKQAEFSMENLLEYEFSHALVTHGSNVHENPHRRLEEFLDFPASPDN